MEARAAEPSSTAPAAAANLPAPPYHHCPAPADEVATPPPKPKPKKSTAGPGLRTPLAVGSGVRVLSARSAAAAASEAAGTSVDESLEIVAVVVAARGRRAVRGARSGVPRNARRHK